MIVRYLSCPAVSFTYEQPHTNMQAYTQIADLNDTRKDGCKKKVKVFLMSPCKRQVGLFPVVVVVFVAVVVVDFVVEECAHKKKEKKEKKMEKTCKKGDGACQAE